ncbi:hypothetical protein DYH09_01710 [bacterium CPR1]|nr:hypothetical protein [bacterium CPR1]
MRPLPPDFSDFLRLLNEHKVQYLLIGGYAVGFYGYPRATGDMDIWVPISPEVASRLVRVLREFGFSDGVTEELFLRPRGIVRLGVPPNRLEVTTHIDGVRFEECYSRREMTLAGDVPVTLISLSDLRTNKKASGRFKDLADLENLPSESP